MHSLHSFVHIEDVAFDYLRPEYPPFGVHNAFACFDLTITNHYQYTYTVN